MSKQKQSALQSCARLAVALPVLHILFGGSNANDEICMTQAKSTGFLEAFEPTRHLPFPGVPLVKNTWTKAASKECFDGHSPQCKLVPSEFHMRYKILNKTVYLDRISAAKRVPEQHKRIVEEMLFISTWLYPKLPDMDIIIDIADGPHFLPDFPVLGFTSHLLSNVTLPGYSIPHPASWRDFAMSSAQLREYASCIDKAYPWEEKLSLAFWRGAMTGGNAGWELSHNPHLNDFNNKTSYIDRILWNKRAYISLLSHSYPYLDVRLTQKEYPEFFANVPVVDPVEMKTLSNLMKGNPLPMEEWNKHAIVISIDGHGTPWRLPLQLLGNSLVIRMESNQLDWYDSIFNAHDNPTFKFDLSDFIPVMKRMLQKIIGEPRTVQGMVNKTRTAAIARFNVLSVLDAFTWGIRDAWSHCDWEVEMDEGFQPIKVELPFVNQFIPTEVAERIMKDRGRNFLHKEDRA